MNNFYYSSTVNGKNIFARKWLPNNTIKSKGIVQIAHGMVEHSGRYADFAKFLCDNGYIVVANDHLGHGHTAVLPDEYGYFSKSNGWFNVVSDIHKLREIMEVQYPNLPYFMMGHSMGSILMRTYATKYTSNPPTAYIISGTSGVKAGLRKGTFLADKIILFNGDKYHSIILENAVIGAFNTPFKPNRTNSDWLTSVNEEVDKYVNDELCKFKFTASAYRDIFIGLQYLSNQKNINLTPNVPFLIFSGAMDPVGEIGIGVKRVVNMLEIAGVQDIIFELFENGRHEMLNEVNRDDVYNMILTFLNKNIKK